MNIHVDHTANEYMEEYHPRFTRALMLQTTKAQLQQASGTITSHYDSIVHYQLGQKVLQEYIAKHCQLSHDHLSDIHWKLYQSNLLYHKSTIIWNTKYIFNHLPTKNTHGKYDITQHHDCPYCNMPKGQWTHYLQCPLVLWQTDKMLLLCSLHNSMEKLETALDIQFTIYYCLHQTFSSAPVDLVIIPNALQSTVLQQNRIGWISFLKGLWH